MMQGDQRNKEYDFESLQKLLKDLQEWEMKYSEKFSEEPMRKRNRAHAVDLVLKPNGELDSDYLEERIRKCKDEYIKVRIPSDVDVYISTKENDTSECRRREIPKRIPEYFV